MCTGHTLFRMFHRPSLLGGREQGWICAGPTDGRSVCPQIMSVLLFIEHSVEVVHSKATCKVWQKGYLRLGRSWGLWSRRGRCGESRCGEGPWLWADRLGFVALPLPF